MNTPTENAIGDQMISDGIFWFSLGCAHGCPLAVDLNVIHSLFVIASPSSTRQLHILENLYAEQVRHYDRSHVLSRDMSSYDCRRTLEAIDDDDGSLVLIDGIDRLFTGLRSDAGIRHVNRRIDSLLHAHVVITDTFRDSSTRIGSLARKSGFVMSVGQMTPLYSQLAFGSSIGGISKDSWLATVMMHSSSEVSSFRLKNHILKGNIQ